MNKFTKRAIGIAEKCTARCLMTSPVCSVNHYEVLGVSRSATIADIKAAYYKKSKECHPDLNLENDDAATQFRAITEAYEVLGNIHSKKLYDKGATFSAQSIPMTPEERFHKSRGKIVPSQGNFKIYDFDEWTQAHYSRSFKDKQGVKRSHIKVRTSNVFSNTCYYETYIIVAIAVGMMCFLCFFHDTSYDHVKTKNVPSKND